MQFSFKLFRKRKQLQMKKISILYFMFSYTKFFIFLYGFMFLSSVQGSLGAPGNNHFISACRASLLFLRALQVLSVFCFPGNVLIQSLFSKGYFPGYCILGQLSFSFSTLNMQFHCHLASIVPDEQLPAHLIDDPFKMLNHLFYCFKSSLSAF